MMKQRGSGRLSEDSAVRLHLLMCVSLLGSSGTSEDADALGTLARPARAIPLEIGLALLICLYQHCELDAYRKSKWLENRDVPPLAKFCSVFSLSQNTGGGCCVRHIFVLKLAGG